MRQATDILIKAVKAGKKGSDRLLKEHRSELVAHCTWRYDKELAKRLEKKRGKFTTL